LGRPVTQQELAENLFLVEFPADIWLLHRITESGDVSIFLLVLLNDLWPVAAISKRDVELLNTLNSYRFHNLL